MNRSRWLWLMWLALLAGCAAWSKVEQTSFTAPDRSYSVELPLGWVRHHLGRSDNDIFITYDGPAIEHIEIAKRDAKEAFPKIKKAASENMLAFELAELMVADLKAVEALSNLTVVGNSPVMIAGRPGFKLDLRVKNSKGLEFEMLVYGVAGRNGFYTLTYQAPRLHYFDKYSGVFEKMVASFKLL